jgi:hypothetical protein
LRRYCLLKHVIEGKIERKIDVTWRLETRRKKLLDNIKEKRRCWKLEEEALDLTLWRARFGRDYGPVVKKTTEWINYILQLLLRLLLLLLFFIIIMEEEISDKRRKLTEMLRILTCKVRI